MEWFIDNGIGYLGLALMVAALIVVGECWSRRKAERLDTELTAYVAEGTLTADTAKAILGSKATTWRKREVAALIAGGMDPSQGLTLLDSMAAQ
jgi:hypothetical protein